MRYSSPSLSTEALLKMAKNGLIAAFNTDDIRRGTPIVTELEVAVLKLSSLKPNDASARQLELVHRRLTRGSMQTCQTKFPTQFPVWLWDAAMGRSN